MTAQHCYYNLMQWVRCVGKSAPAAGLTHLQVEHHREYGRMGSSLGSPLNPACMAAAEKGEARSEGVVAMFDLCFNHQYEVSNRTCIRQKTEQ